MKRKRRIGLILLCCWFFAACSLGREAGFLRSMVVGVFPQGFIERGLAAYGGEEFSMEKIILQEAFATREIDYSESTRDFFVGSETLLSLQSSRQVQDSIKESELPKELLAILKEASLYSMKLGYSDQDILGKYRVEDEEISYEEMLDWFKFTREDAEDRYWEESRITAWLMDSNGDGEAELLQCVDSNGTLRSSDIKLWQKEDGEAVLVDSSTTWVGHDNLFRIQDNYYLIRGNFSFNTREDLGYIVLSFGAEEGMAEHYFSFANPTLKKDWFQTYKNEKADQKLTEELENYLKENQAALEEKLDYTGYGIFSVRHWILMETMFWR